MAKRIIMVLASILCLMQMHAETYISDIKIGGGSTTDKTVAYNNAANGGYTVIDYDLNKGAKGDFIYLSYKTTTDPAKAITNIIIISGFGDDKYLTTPIKLGGKNYYKAPYEDENSGQGNLNNNSGGDNLFMFYTREGCSKVTDIIVNTTQSGAVSGYQYINFLNIKGFAEIKEVDLNRNTTKESPIYLHLLRRIVHTFPDDNNTICSTCGVARCYYEYGNMVYGACENKTVPLGNDAFDQPYSHDGYPSRYLQFDVAPKTINNYAFDSCTKLRKITLPSSITSIGHSAFCFCGSLFTINLPDGLKTIGDYAFYQCVFSDIVIPNSVETIGYAAFKDNRNLNNVTLSNSLTELSDCLFEDCTGLGNLAIPNSVKRIGQKCFRNCYELHDVTLPSSLTDIGKNAFAKCTKLTSITLPSTVTNIETYAFAYCKSLKTIYCESETPAKIGVNVFQGCPLDYVIYVPENAVETYKNADGWKFHKDHIMSIGNKELHESGYENAELAQGALYNRLLSINKRLDNISAFLMRSNAAAAPADVVEPAKKNAMESVISGTLTFSSLKSYSVVDVDHNNKVNKADITKIVDYVIGNNNDSKQAISTSDMNGLGEDLCTKFSRMTSLLKLKGEIDGHEYVNMGLPSGLLWARCNIGTLNPGDRTSKLYAWGETETKDEYTEENYKWYNGTYESLNKYCLNCMKGTVDGKIDLDADDDVARQSWGGRWRIPTDNEWKELIEGCDITKKGNIKDAKIILTSKVNGNQLILPIEHLSIQRYLSSSGDGNSCANAFVADDSSTGVSVYVTRDLAYYRAMIRPVISYEETLEK